MNDTLPPTRPVLTIEEKYNRMLEKNRLRQRKWYDKNKRKVAILRSEDRQLFRQLKDQAGVTPPPPQQLEEPTYDDNVVPFDDEPEPEQVRAPEPPKQVIKFST